MAVVAVILASLFIGLLIVMALANYVGGDDDEDY